VANINNLSNEIIREMQRYSRVVAEDVEEAKKETAKDLVKDLKRTSPEKTGDYQKGWRIKKSGNKLVIHNKTDYQLTHLLEHGHAKRNGGRVSAQIHIRPAEEKAIREYLDKIEQAVQR
jgi:type II secretory pathway predicted ATPase ExeA